MATIQIVRNTPLYLSTILVKINGESYKLRANTTLNIEVPEGNYELMVCNDYELFEGRTVIETTDDISVTVEVSLTNSKGYRLFLFTLLLMAFICIFFLKLSTFVWGAIIFATLGAYWGIQYLNRKKYFNLQIKEDINS